MNSVDQEDDDDDEEDEEVGMFGLNTMEEDEYEIVDDDLCYEVVYDSDGPPPLMIETEDDMEIIELNPFSDIADDDSDEDQADEEEDEDPKKAEMVAAIEKQLKITREIKQDEVKSDPWQATEKDPWQAPKRPLKNSVTSALIRGMPKSKATGNPFETLGEVELQPEGEQTDGSSFGRILQNLKSLNTSISSPSISPIAKTVNQAQATAQHFRMNDSIESPPGLEEREVRVVISGMGSDIVIMGKHINGEMSMELDSTVRKISTSTDSNAASKEAEVHVEEEIKKNTYESIDTLGLESDTDNVEPEDIIYDLAKIERDDDLPFPVSFPVDRIKRSKSRKKKERKRLMKMEAICTEDCCQPYNTETTAPNDVSASSSTLCEELAPRVIDTSVSLVVPYLEDAAWKVITEMRDEVDRCLGGCPPPTDELSLAKHLVGEDNFVKYEIINDIQEDQFEIVYEEYCHGVDYIFEGCIAADETDLFEIFVSNIMQQAFWYDDHIELFEDNI